MAVAGNMKVKSKSGYMPGSYRGLPGEIEIIAFETEVTAPRETASGKRSKARCRVLKIVDPSTPELHTALVTNAVLDSVHFEFIRPDEGTGRPYVYWIIDLTKVSVVSQQRTVAPADTTAHHGAYDVRDLEQIQFEAEQMISRATGPKPEADFWYVR